MSKPVTGLNVFQGQAGPIPLSQLDNNISALQNAINDLNTYGNYFTDTSGAANAITVTVTAPLTVTYNTSLRVTVKVANTNTNTTPTLNINGLGVVTIINFDGSAIFVGQLVATGVYEFWYDGTNFRVLQLAPRFTPTTQPVFIAQRLTSTQSLPASTTTAIIFNNTTKNVGSIFSTITGAMTAATAGTYRVSTTLVLQNNASGAAVIVQVFLSKNGAGPVTAGSAVYVGGVTLGSAIGASSNAFTISGSGLFDLAVTDQLAVYVQMGTIGGAGAFTLNPGSTFEAELIA